MIMTLVQLRHLISLADTGSFSRAAERQHLTQPALSRSIAALEDEVGGRLFDRIGRRAEPTPLGRELLTRARQLVADADELVAQGQAVRGARAGTLRVGLGSGPGALLTVPLLQRVAAQGQGLRLELRRGGTALLVDALRARALDALVVDAYSLPPAPDLRCEIIGELPGGFLCRRGHPLLRKRRPLRFAELQAWPIAATPLSDAVAAVLMDRYGPEAHPERCVTLRGDDLAGLVEATAASDAVLIAVRAAAPGLAELRVEPPLQAVARFGLVTLAGRSPPPALALLRTLARERCA
ncbi:LysR family transcriptional regulator [Ideonella alba]|nr:LysR family transcriptional regulator [Ideonella alba]